MSKEYVVDGLGARMAALLLLCMIAAALMGWGLRMSAALGADSTHQVCA